MSNVAKTAIERSISHNEIVTIDFSVVNYDSRIMADLVATCDDWTEANDDVVEYWGTTDDGQEWRVQVKGQLGVRAECDV